MKRMDELKVREAVLLIPSGEIFTVYDVISLIGNKAPSTSSVGYYLRQFDDLVERLPSHAHKERPWRRI